MERELLGRGKGRKQRIVFIEGNTQWKVDIRKASQVAILCLQSNCTNSHGQMEALASDGLV